MKTLALLVLAWGISLNHLPIETPMGTAAEKFLVQNAASTQEMFKNSTAILNNTAVNLSAKTLITDTTAPLATCASTELMRKQMVDLINHARSQSRVCGLMQFDDAPPVRWNYSLEKAARMHSQRMATQNFFAHRGPDSTHVGIRVQEVGYNWQFVGENIYAGIETVTEAVYGWLDSEGHCKTIMNPDYTELGAACVTNRSSQYESYWTQVFASPMQD